MKSPRRCARTHRVARRHAIRRRDEVLGHHLVHGELLIGERSGLRETIGTAYAEMHRAPLVSDDAVVELVKSRELGGRGIGSMTPICQPPRGRPLDVFTADPALAGVAEDLGIAHGATP